MAVEADKPIILYVEDDEETFRLAALRLRSKYVLLSAVNDQEACVQLKHWGNRLYAILLDVELQASQLDGFKLLQLVRGRLPPAQVPPYARDVPMLQVPVIVMTAYAGRYSEAEAKELGASHMLAKPIDFTRLSLALAQANIMSVMARLVDKGAPVD